MNTCVLFCGVSDIGHFLSKFGRGEIPSGDCPRKGKNSTFVAMKEKRILVVDDDPDILTAVKMSLRKMVGEVVTEKNPEMIRSHLERGGFDLLLLDMNFNASINTGNEGLYWLSKVKEWNREIAVVMITAYADIDLAVSSLKMGADDFMVKPWSNEYLIDTISTLFDRASGGSGSQKGRKMGGVSAGMGMIGESKGMTDLFKKIEKIAPTDANVLILGENGTGKELVAKAIYGYSARKNKPFVKVDLGSLTDSLFESELFGHKKGAFTDAKSDRMGLIESANGGTLFLDEIANIELYQQAKLLTVLQNREVIRLGDNKVIPLDIRLISATNASLSTLADESKFRKDLIYRINTIELHLPPLRERGKDIELLASHFISIYADKYSKGSMNLSQEAMRKLEGHPFPGNVRELQYCIERAVIMSESSTLSADDIVFSPIESPVKQDEKGGVTDLAGLEAAAIIKALEKHSGNISKAAKELGITRASLYRRMEKHGI